MGMKASSNHYGFINGAGGPSKRNGGQKFELNIQLFAKMPKNPAQLKHIMANRTGHLPNTKKNKKLLQRISKNKRNYIGSDGHGNKIYSRVIKGKEYWVYERNGIIQNGGVNIKTFRYHKKGGK